jgi:hypothetical protein
MISPAIGWPGLDAVSLAKKTRRVDNGPIFLNKECLAEQSLQPGHSMAIRECPKALVLLILAVLSAIGVLFITWYSSPRSYRSWSVAEAKQNGTFVAQLAVVPETISWKGKKIRFREAWVEERLEENGNLIIPYKRTGDYNICFTLQEGNNIFFEPDDPFFVLEDNESGFLVTYDPDGKVLFLRLVDKPIVDNFRLSLIQTWSEKKAKDICLVMLSWP